MASQGERRRSVKRQRKASEISDGKSLTNLKTMTNTKTTKVKVRGAPLAVDIQGGICCCAPVAFNKNRNRKVRLRHIRRCRGKAQPNTPKSQCLQRTSAHFNRNPNDGEQNLKLMFNDPETADIRVCLRGNNGASLTLALHRCVLVNSSGLFKSQLSKSRDQCCVEITECVDMEMFVETLRLMYLSHSHPPSHTDLGRRLMHHSVLRVLRILQIAATISFEAGMVSCLEHLERVPWSEKEEETLIALLKHPCLRSCFTARVSSAPVLSRVLTLQQTNNDGASTVEILPRLIEIVMQSEKEKGRKEMKCLVSRLVREKTSDEERAEAIVFSACKASLEKLKSAVQEQRKSDTAEYSIALSMGKHADNLQWLFEMLSGMRAAEAEEFVALWAQQSHVAQQLEHVPAARRYHLSRVTASVCVAIGGGHLMVSLETRVQFVQTWMEALVNDYAWLQRACKGQLDMSVLEEAMCKTILTLPLHLQRNVLLSWLNHFLHNSLDSPNLKPAFQVWWRRAFLTSQCPLTA